MGFERISSFSIIVCASRMPCRTPKITVASVEGGNAASSWSWKMVNVDSLTHPILPKQKDSRNSELASSGSRKSRPHRRPNSRSMSASFSST